MRTLLEILSETHFRNPRTHKISRHWRRATWKQFPRVRHPNDLCSNDVIMRINTQRVCCLIYGNSVLDGPACFFSLNRLSLCPLKFIIRIFPSTFIMLEVPLLAYEISELCFEWCRYFEWCRRCSDLTSSYGRHVDFILGTERVKGGFWRQDSF
jgi:hypothetical protein